MIAHPAVEHRLNWMGASGGWTGDEMAHHNLAIIEALCLGDGMYGIANVGDSRAQTLHVFLQFQRRTEHVGDLLRQIANRNLPARAKIDYFADRQQPRNRVEDVVEIPSRQQITHFEDDEAALPV